MLPFWNTFELPAQKDYTTTTFLQYCYTSHFTSHFTFLLYFYTTATSDFYFKKSLNKVALSGSAETKICFHEFLKIVEKVIKL